MRTIVITSVSACAVAITMTAGCGSTSSPSEETAPPAQEQTEAPPAPTTPEAAPATPEAAPAAPAAEQWPMPDLVGQVLQDAQDQIQAVTGGSVFFTNSHDLSGQDRNQVLDANWQVCTQNVAPGAAVTPDSLIDVGVVKLTEACP